MRVSHNGLYIWAFTRWNINVNGHFVLMREREVECRIPEIQWSYIMLKVVWRSLDQKMIIFNVYHSHHEAHTQSLCKISKWRVFASQISILDYPSDKFLQLIERKVGHCPKGLLFSKHFYVSTHYIFLMIDHLCLDQTVIPECSVSSKHAL